MFGNLTSKLPQLRVEPSRRWFACSYCCLLQQNHSHMSSFLFSTDYSCRFLILAATTNCRFERRYRHLPGQAPIDIEHQCLPVDCRRCPHHSRTPRHGQIDRKWQRQGHHFQWRSNDHEIIGHHSSGSENFGWHRQVTGCWSEFLSSLLAIWSINECFDFFFRLVTAPPVLFYSPASF